MLVILVVKDCVESLNLYCFNFWYYFGVVDVNGYMYMLF